MVRVRQYVVCRSVVVGVLVSVVLLVCGFTCEDPYKTNPNFVLLMGQDGVYPTDPKPSPDGRLIYYLVDTTYRGSSPDGVVGELRVRNVVDSTDRLLLAGDYYKLALSRDGRTVALAAGGDSTRSFFLLLDTSGASLDTVYANHPANWYVSDHALSSDGSLLYYLSGDGRTTNLYSVDLPQLGDAELVQSFPWHLYWFDLFDGDSIFTDSSIGTDPAVNPVHTRWAVWAGCDRYAWLWELHDRHTGKSEPWGSETQPYVGCDLLMDPAWTADGRDLVFVVAHQITAGNWSRSEVWILKNAVDLLPQK